METENQDSNNYFRQKSPMETENNVEKFDKRVFA